MRLTNETLKRIIKEELNHLMLEQKAEAVADKAEKILDNQKAQQAIQKDLDSKPEIAAALEKFMSELPQDMSEAYYGGDEEGMERYLRSKGAHPDQQQRFDQNTDNDGTGELMAGGMFAGAMASPMLASMVMHSDAGKQLVSALAPYIDPGLSQLLLGGGTMVGSVVAPAAAALALSFLVQHIKGK
jgi:hypothetical protein